MYLLYVPIQAYTRIYPNIRCTLPVACPTSEDRSTPSNITHLEHHAYLKAHSNMRIDATNALFDS